MKTIRDLFINNSDYYNTISLTDNYMLYIECLDSDYVSLANNFTLDKVSHLMIELNDYNGNYYEPIQNYFNEEITLDTSLEDLKNKVLDLAIKRGLDNEGKIITKEKAKDLVYNIVQSEINDLEGDYETFLESYKNADLGDIYENACNSVLNKFEDLIEDI